MTWFAWGFERQRRGGVFNVCVISCFWILYLQVGLFPESWANSRESL